MLRDSKRDRWLQRLGWESPQARRHAAIAVLIIGCGTVSHGLASDLLLGPGDKVSVTVLRRPDLSGEFRVQPSGDLTFPLLGRVVADDRSLEDVRESVVERLRTAAFMRDPKVSLDLVEASPVTVGGDVQRPGSYPYQTGMTIQHALAAAGGHRLVDVDAFNARTEMRRTRERLLQTMDQYGLTMLRRQRLVTELQDGTVVPVPDGIDRWLSADRLKTALTAESDLLSRRKESFDNQVESLAKQTGIYQDEIKNLEQQDAAKASEAAVIGQEHAIQQQLFGKGLVIRDQAVVFQRSAMELQSDRSQIAAEIARARQGLERTSQSVDALRDQRRLDIANMIKDADDTLANLNVTIDQSRKSLREADEVLPLPGASSATAAEGPFTLVRTRKGAAVRLPADGSTEIQPGDLVLVNKS